MPLVMLSSAVLRHATTIRLRQVEKEKKGIEHNNNNNDNNNNDNNNDNNNNNQVEKEKKGIEHKKYVTDLFDYLRSFYERTHPLADFDEILKVHPRSTADL